MSGEADHSAVVETIRESVTGTLDRDELESMLEGDTTRSVGRELGARVGRELGSVVGGELGAVVAVDVRERKGPRAILADVKRRLLELLRSILRSADLASGLSRLRELGTDLDASGTPAELLETVVPGEEDGASGNESGAEESEAEEESGTDENESGAEEGFAGVPVDDLDEMREETYRELLEVMSYSDLQSIAKEVGVKANLSKEEMTDRIVEEFSEHKSEG